jgi:uracil-DNA glycosylase
LGFECQKCGQYGLSFNRLYSPPQFLEGRANSPIWIIGLNPKGSPGKVDLHNADELQNYFQGETHSYFNDFEIVSERLYNLLGEDKGVAHTDIVKCYSNEFPPGGCNNKDSNVIIGNCREYLEKQITEFNPKIIVCNGAPVCKVIKSIIAPPKGNNITSYIGKMNGSEVAVVLSGFIGRIDTYAKWRLGKEIEFYMDKYNII